MSDFRFMALRLTNTIFDSASLARLSLQHIIQFLEFCDLCDTLEQQGPGCEHSARGSGEINGQLHQLSQKRQP